MIYKINTHENFVVIELQSPISNNEAFEKVNKQIEAFWIAKQHVVLHLNQFEPLVQVFLDELIVWHSKFYAQECSFVVCELSPSVRASLSLEYFEQINYAPQLIEAIDIVSMEILERDLLSDFEE